MTGKLIIFSAPSGSGKSTIINYLLTQNLNLAFSISATSRLPRGTEQHGVEYFFLTPEEFRCRIENNEFLEYEEVYKDRYYGTLKAQVEKQLEAGQNVVFDVDVISRSFMVTVRCQCSFNRLRWKNYVAGWKDAERMLRKSLKAVLLRRNTNWGLLRNSIVWLSMTIWKLRRQKR